MASVVLFGQDGLIAVRAENRPPSKHPSHQDGRFGKLLPAPHFVRMVGGVPMQGSLNDPLGVAISPAEDGRVYVVDSGNARIQVYSSGLHPIGAFGRRGKGPGEFWQPSDAAVSPDGEYLYVVDRGTGVIQRFEPRAECFRPFRADCFTGQHVLQFGGKGIGDDFFQDPTGLAVDGEGSLFVADRGAHVIKKFAGPEPTFLMKFGGLGFSSGKLSDPTDVAVGPEGKVWVADSGNDRVSIFANDGKFEKNFSGGDLMLYHPTGIAVGADGSSLVRFYDPSYSNPAVMRFDGKRKPAWKEPLALGGEDTDLAQYFPLQGVALTADGKALLTDQFAPEFSLVSLPIADEPRSVPVATRGREQQQFDSPVDVAALGNIVAISDRRNRRVQLLDVSRNFSALGIVGGPLNDEVKFESPRGVAIWAPGQSTSGPGIPIPIPLPQPDAVRVFVADPGQNSIFIVDAKGNYVGRIGDGKARSGPDGLSKPFDVAVGPDGNIYIADTGNHRIVRRTPGGGDAGPPIGEAGPGPGQLQYPAAITFGPHGWLYVLEAGKTRLQAFTLDGKPVLPPWSSPMERIAGEEIPPGELWSPVSLAGDSDQLYVLESSSDDNWVRIQVLQPEVGKPLVDSVTTTFANRTGPGDGELWQPSGIGLSGEGEIYVADTGNNRLQLFRWSDDIGAPTPTTPPTSPPPTDLPPTAPPTETPSLATVVPSPTASATATPTLEPPKPTPTLPPPSSTPTPTRSPSLPPTETPFASKATATPALPTATRPGEATPTLQTGSPPRPTSAASQQLPSFVVYVPRVFRSYRR